jgi:transcriptional regulator with XRE-family HTH domain
MGSMTPSRVRKIRKALGFTQEDFARTLWVTYTTLNRWEAGHSAPTGMHLRILRLLERNLARASFKAALRDPRATDPMFLLHRLLEPLYGDRSARRRGGPGVLPRQLRDRAEISSRSSGWNALSTEVQERIIGRRKHDDIELNDSVKPTSVHNALTTNRRGRKRDQDPA